MSSKAILDSVTPPILSETKQCPGVVKGVKFDYDDVREVYQGIGPECTDGHTGLAVCPLGLGFAGLTLEVEAHCKF